MIDKIQAYRKTKKGAFALMAIAVVFLAVFASWAVDSGSLWHWAIAIISLYCTVLFIGDIFSTQKSKSNAKKRRTKKTA